MNHNSLVYYVYDYFVLCIIYASSTCVAEYKFCCINIVASAIVYYSTLWYRHLSNTDPRVFSLEINHLPLFFMYTKIYPVHLKHSAQICQLSGYKLLWLEGLTPACSTAGICFPRCLVESLGLHGQGLTLVDQVVKLFPSFKHCLNCIVLERSLN